MKVFFDTVGCRLNQAEIEAMAGQFRVAGHEVISSAIGADIVVINSCAVTAAAASDSRQKVRQANKAGAGKIILTGCWVTLEPEKARELPGVSEILTNLEKQNLPQRVLNLSEEELIEMEPIERHALPGIHQKTRAFIKAQDGCDNFCTFCVTRIARGPGRSVPKEEVLESVTAAVKGGVKEIVLTGVNLGSWGKDLGNDWRLKDLLKYLLQNSTIERIRLSSVEPWDIDDKFFDLWQDHRMCRHLHLPLQSGSAAELRRMGRKTSPQDYMALVHQARHQIPGLAVTTDIIVGFPGESVEEFQESLSFVRSIDFSGGHVFTYSAREGTSSYNFTGRVNGKIAQERAAQMKNAILECEGNFNEGFIGKRLKVLWEARAEKLTDQWVMRGFSDNYIKVTAVSRTNSWNQIDEVEITKKAALGLVGIIQEL
jgi:threonylcarbamoyladenosine tRNA methylthiotransferase MtaB